MLAIRARTRLPPQESRLLPRTPITAVSRGSQALRLAMPRRLRRCVELCARSGERCAKTRYKRRMVAAYAEPDMGHQQGMADARTRYLWRERLDRAPPTFSTTRSCNRASRRGLSIRTTSQPARPARSMVSSRKHCVVVNGSSRIFGRSRTAPCSHCRRCSPGRDWRGTRRDRLSTGSAPSRPIGAHL